MQWGAWRQKSGEIKDFAKKAAQASVKTAGLLAAAGMLSLSLYAKKPLAEEAQKSYFPSLKAPITIVMENHTIGSHRGMLMPLADSLDAKKIYFELIHPYYQSQINAYLKSASDTLPEGLNYELYLQSREAGAEENNNSYAKILYACKKGGKLAYAMNFISASKNIISEQDSAYASVLCQAFAKDSAPIIAYVGGCHGKGIKKWLGKLGIEAQLIVVWDSEENPKKLGENHLSKITYEYEWQVERAISALNLAPGLYRLDGASGIDYAYVFDKNLLDSMPMPPLVPKKEWKQR